MVYIYEAQWIMGISWHQKTTISVIYLHISVCSVCHRRPMLLQSENTVMCSSWKREVLLSNYCQPVIMTRANHQGVRTAICEFYARQFSEEKELIYGRTEWSTCVGMFVRYRPHFVTYHVEILRVESVRKSVYGILISTIIVFNVYHWLEQILKRWDESALLCGRVRTSKSEEKYHVWCSFCCFSEWWIEWNNIHLLYLEVILVNY